MLRRGIGYVIQDAGLFPHYTVERNVGLVPWLEKWPEDRKRARVAEMLQLIGFDPHNSRSDIRTNFPAASASALASRAPSPRIRRYC